MINVGKLNYHEETISFSAKKLIVKFNDLFGIFNTNMLKSYLYLSET